MQRVSVGFFQEQSVEAVRAAAGSVSSHTCTPLGPGVQRQVTSCSDTNGPVWVNPGESSRVALRSRFKVNLFIQQNWDAV